MTILLVRTGRFKAHALAEDIFRSGAAGLSSSRPSAEIKAHALLMHTRDGLAKEPRGDAFCPSLSPDRHPFLDATAALR